MQTLTTCSTMGAIHDWVGNDRNHLAILMLAIEWEYIAYSAQRPHHWATTAASLIYVRVHLHLVVLLNRPCRKRTNQAVNPSRR